uniref:Uncharacterized protein n=1 Tax=Rhizophora mucronata TaxID=61149 RepID=A0A2P2PB32_RHIMU
MLTRWWHFFLFDCLFTSRKTPIFL